MKAIIFNYVARYHIVGKSQSLDCQKQINTDYAQRNGFEIQENYSHGPGSPKEHDKIIDSIVENVSASQEPIALVCSSINRLQRNLKKYAILDDLRKRGKIELHFVRENLIIHQDSSSGDLMRWCMGILHAQNYFLQLSESVKRAKRSKKIPDHV